MAIQVLLGAEDRVLGTALAAQFHELPDAEIIGVEVTSTDVVSAVGSVPDLDVVLIHQQLGPLPALDLIRELGLRHPQLAVVLIAEEATAETYAAAMGAGARGVISNDPTLAELQSRIETAGEWSRTMRRHFDSSFTNPMPGRLGTMLAICGAKGGTGATTLAVHLATAVSAKRSVCLVDMDLQKGDIPTYLDVQHRRSIADLVRAADDLDGAILSEALFVHRDGPHLLLAPDDGEQAEDVNARAVRQILAALRSRYEVVIVDCGAHVSEGSAMAVELADMALITVTPDLPAIRAAKRLAKLWNRLQIRSDEGVAAVLNRHDRKHEIQPDLARKMLGLKLLETTIPAGFKALEQAANTGSPLEAKDQAFKKAIAGVARETVLAEAPAASEEVKDRGATLVEFAGIIPFLGLVLLVVWQGLVTGLTSMYASHAAGEAARAVAVLGYDTPQSKQEVQDRTTARISGKWSNDQHFKLNVAGDQVTVSIETPFFLPGWRAGFDVTATATVVPEGKG